MHHFIHGDYLLSSRNFLNSLIEQEKRQNKEVVRLDGNSLALNDLIQALASNSLFGGEKVVVIENLFSRQKSKDQEILLEWIKTFDGQTPVIFWEKKTIGKILQRRLPKKTTVKEFKTPATVFKLVELLSPQTKKQALQLLEETVVKEPAEFLFAMICRQIRLMLLLKEGQAVGGAPWMVGKLKKQAASFNKDELINSYQKLYFIDKQIKTGKTLMPLSWHLSVWISEL